MCDGPLHIESIPGPPGPLLEFKRLNYLWIFRTMNSTQKKIRVLLTPGPSSGIGVMAKQSLPSDSYLINSTAPLVNVDLKDKTVIVVGANTGLNTGAIQHFVKMGASKLSNSRAGAAIQPELTSSSMHLTYSQ